MFVLVTSLAFWYASDVPGEIYVAFWPIPSYEFQCSIDLLMSAMCKAHALLATNAASSHYWRAHDDHVELFYKPLENPAAHKAIFDMFNPKIHWEHLALWVQRYRRKITVVDLATPYIESAAWIRDWCEQQGLIVFSNLYLPRMLPNHTDSRVVLLDDMHWRGDFLRVYFTDRNKAVLSKLIAPGTIIPPDNQQ